MGPLAGLLPFCHIAKQCIIGKTTTCGPNQGECERSYRTNHRPSGGKVSGFEFGLLQCQ